MSREVIVASIACVIVVIALVSWKVPCSWHEHNFRHMQIDDREKFPLNENLCAADSPPCSSHHSESSLLKRKGSVKVTLWRSTPDRNFISSCTALKQCIVCILSGSLCTHGLIFWIRQIKGVIIHKNVVILALKLCLQIYCIAIIILSGNPGLRKHHVEFAPYQRTMLMRSNNH